MDEITAGARLRTLRRWRGLTQAEPAGLAAAGGSGRAGGRELRGMAARMGGPH
jgi:hypothetical protein